MDLSFLSNMRFFNSEDGLDLLRSGGMITMSWGVDNIQILEHDGESRGLKFSVNGYKFQGEVTLSVNFLDYYQIRFFQDGKEVDMFDDVVVFDVINMIDEKVEKQENYSY
jgi:hypothetical protein